MSRSTIKNQIFLGIPWKNIKTKYEKIQAEMNRKYPLSLVIIGRSENQDANDLLEEIENKILSSDYAVFDATNGNPNVSLEYGFAEGAGIKRKLYICKHVSVQTSRKEKPIISDLGGKKYSSYTTENKLRGLLNAFCKQHEYTKRFERFIKKQNVASKRRLRKLSLKIIHALDEKDNFRKMDIAQTIQDDQPGVFTEREVIQTITLLKDNKLLSCAGGGPNPEYWIREK